MKTDVLTPIATTKPPYVKATDLLKSDPRAWVEFMSTIFPIDDDQEFELHERPKAAVRPTTPKRPKASAE